MFEIWFFSNLVSEHKISMRIYTLIVQSDANKLHDFYFADISSSYKQKLKTFIPNWSSWKDESMQTKQSKIVWGV